MVGIAALAGKAFGAIKGAIKNKKAKKGAKKSGATEIKKAAKDLLSQKTQGALNIDSFERGEGETAQEHGARMIQSAGAALAAGQSYAANKKPGFGVETNIRKGFLTGTMQTTILKIGGAIAAFAIAIWGLRKAFGRKTSKRLYR